MLKKLQSLKAKKGFTLVELIVVIAIIAVLAAILVPTMLGYVTNSRVSSANTTAATLKDTINTFIADMDTKGYTTVKDPDFTRALGDKTTNAWVIKANSTIKTTIDDTTINVSVTIDEDTLSSSTQKVKTAYANELAKVIADDFNFKEAYAVAYIDKGRCIGVVYSATTDVSTGKVGEKAIPSFKSFSGAALAEGEKAFEWDDKDGILGGEVVGTAPAITSTLAADKTS